MNNINIIGNLVEAPDLRYTQTEKAVCNMRIAVNNPYNRDETYFFTVIAWNKLAETVANALDKGQKVGVTGRLTSRSYERKDGGKATAVEIVADSIDFLSPKKPAQQPAPAQDSNLDEWNKLGREVKSDDLDMFDGKADDDSIPF